nr:hypothetical protein [Tanacetum cinerariifolium]
NDDIRNSKAYKEYYACATGEAAPKPKAGARKKTCSSASSTTPPTPIATPTPTTTVVAAPRLSANGADKRRTFLSNVVLEELSWNSSDDEDVDEQTKGSEESEGDKTDESDDDDDEEETTKIGEKEEDESFDPIPRTLEDDEDDDNNEEDQGLRIGEEERMQEEEDAEELYHDVDINQGRGLQVSQETKDTHVILTPTQSNTQQESSSTSSFMTNLLNPITDPGLESLFTTGSTTMEGNKSIQRSDEQRNLYKVLVEAYDADKTILDTYGESTILKRRREDDDQEGPSAGSDRGSTTGSQSRQLSASESVFAEEPVQPTCQMEEPSHPPSRPPTPDRDWNKSVTAAQGNAQSWISTLAKQTDARYLFNELLDTPIDFSNFIMNRLGIETLTP